MAFKARKLKGGFFEILGLEKFLRQKLEQMHRASRLRPPSKKTSRKIQSARSMSMAGPSVPSVLDLLVSALEAHPHRTDLVKAGKKPDQLLRSLIPLYLVRKGDGVSSGVTSRFWNLHGVRYAAPNAAKALREHKGFTKIHRGGRQITPAGVKYVEAALKGKKAA